MYWVLEIYGRCWQRRIVMYLPPQSRNKCSVTHKTFFTQSRIAHFPKQAQLKKQSGGRKEWGKKKKAGTYSSWSADPTSRSTGSREGHKEPYPHTTHPHPLLIPPRPQHSVLLPHIVGSHTRGPLSWRGLQRRPPNWSTPEHWPRENRFTENFGGPQRIDQRWWWKHI